MAFSLSFPLPQGEGNTIGNNHPFLDRGWTRSEGSP